MHRPLLVGYVKDKVRIVARAVVLERWLCAALPVGALVSLFLLHLADMTFADPDLWHQMALAREALSLGYLPFEDRFAYTPTVYPSVQHEWGTGVLLYLLTSACGAAGLMALKYALTASVAAFAVATARRRGASWIAIGCSLPLAIAAGTIGFTTVRAQLFTLVFIAGLLYLFELDRHGNRRWMLVWLPLYVAWLNLHAGFVVGLIFVVCHAADQWRLGEPWRHLLAMAVAMVALVAVNPYGLNYFAYLAHGLAMPRPLVTEWLPLWKTDPGLLRVYAITVALSLYCARSLGWRRTPGLIVLAAATLAAGRHTRHLPIYLLVWTCYFPALVTSTPLGGLLESWCHARRRWVAVASAVCLTLCIARVVPAAPWLLRLPATAEDERQGKPVYPIGAVDYLSQVGFQGNVKVPFVTGGYVMWRLHPSVKVSIDGRYEVAYPRGSLEANVDFYDAKSGWQDILARHATDLVLIPRWSRLAATFGSSLPWQRIYHDDAFELWARPGLEMPRAEARELSRALP